MTNNLKTPGVDTVLNQGIFTAAVEKELVRARTIKDFLSLRIQKVEKTPVSKEIKGKTIEECDIKVQEILKSEMNEKTKNSFTQKLVQLKKFEEDLSVVKEEAYKKGYVDALKHALQFINVLPQA